jgi:hypothetical protein
MEVSLQFHVKPRKVLFNKVERIGPSSWYFQFIAKVSDA